MRSAFRVFLYRADLASLALRSKLSLDQAAARKLRAVREEREPRSARLRAGRGSARDRLRRDLCRLQSAVSPDAVVALASGVARLDAALRGLLDPLFQEPAYHARFLPPAARDPGRRRDAPGPGVPAAFDLGGQYRPARLRPTARRRAYRDPLGAPKTGARRRKRTIQTPAHRVVRRCCFGYWM